MKAAPSSTLAQNTASESLSSADLQILKAPFSRDRLGVKVQSFSKDRSRAMLVLYLQHTDVQDRLEEIDPAWSIQVVGEERIGDSVFVRAQLTLKGVTRENVGEGGDPKAAYSDALKRCAMLFGVGRYLYDMPTVWTEYDDNRDRFRSWTPQDFESAARSHGKRFELPLPSAGSKPRGNEVTEAAEPREGGAPPTAAAPPVAPKATKPSAGKGKASADVSVTRPGLTTGPAAGTRPREELNRILMNLYRPFLNQFPDTQFPKLLQERYGVGETRLMSVEQLEDLVQHLEQRLRSVA